MNDLINEIKEKAIREVEQPANELTKQFLKIHDIERKDGIPVINRIDLENEELGAQVYFNVDGEKFYCVIYLDIDPEVQVRWMGTEGCFTVYLGAGENNLTTSQIAKMTSLVPSRSWNKGDKTKTGGKRGFTKVMFEPNPEADEFEDKLDKLLGYLETDKEGVKKIVELANGCVRVAAIFHNGNTMLGGVCLSVSNMKRLCDLGLEIDFDLYAEGNFFPEEDDEYYDS